jgi:hypothetical protein
VLGDIRRLNVNWKKVAQNRDRWKEVVERDRNLHRLWRFKRERERENTVGFHAMQQKL